MRVLDTATLDQFRATTSGKATYNVSGDFVHPCPGAPISSNFGGRASPGGIGSTNHKGTDFAAATGTPIYAIANGAVEETQTQNKGARGIYAKISHGKMNGHEVETISQHMSQIKVRTGQTVKKGQIIGYVGSTGVATGPHLHFEFWIDGTPVDCRSYMNLGN